MKNILLAIRRILFAKQSREASSTDMGSSSLFYGYSSLTSIPEPLSLEGLGAVTDANEMFYSCTSITNIPASWAGLGVATWSGVCTSLTSIPESWEGLGAVTKARACGGELV